MVDNDFVIFHKTWTKSIRDKFCVWKYYDYNFATKAIINIMIQIPFHWRYIDTLWCSTTDNQGHKGQLAPRCRALDVMIKTFYHVIQKAVHPFRFKNGEPILLGSGGLGGGGHNLRPGCRRRLLGHFTPPLGTLRLDAPALFRVRSPNDGNTLGSS